MNKPNPFSHLDCPNCDTEIDAAQVPNDGTLAVCPHCRFAAPGWAWIEYNALIAHCERTHGVLDDAPAGGGEVPYQASAWPWPWIFATVIVIGLIAAMLYWGKP